MIPQVFTISPTYKKDSELWVLELDKLPDFSRHSLVYFPPGQIGGNHSHPRAECFACINGKLKLYWLENGKTQSLDMVSAHEETLTTYIISPHLIHAVKNETDQPAMLLELASEFQHDIKTMPIIE